MRLTCNPQEHARTRLLKEKRGRHRGTGGMIRIEYQNTFDDFREANGMPARRGGRRWWGAVLGGVLVAVGIAAFLLLTFGILTVLGGDAAPGEPFPWGRLALVLTPSAVLFVLFAWGVFRQASKAPEPWNPPPQASRAPTLRGLGGWLLSFVLAGCLLFLFNRTATTSAPGATSAASAPPQRLPSYFEHLLPLLGWAYLVLFLVLLGRFQRTRGILSMWAALHHEREPRVLHVTDSGVTIEQPSARLEYGWGYFAGYRETENLVVLYTSPYAFFMIPKRAFGDAAQLAAFKGFVMSGIPRGHFLPAESNAFPVVPTARLAAPAPPPPPGRG